MPSESLATIEIAIMKGQQQNLPGIRAGNSVRSDHWEVTKSIDPRIE